MYFLLYCGFIEIFYKKQENSKFKILENLTISKNFQALEFFLTLSYLALKGIIYLFNLLFNSSHCRDLTRVRKNQYV